MRPLKAQLLIVLLLSSDNTKLVDVANAAPNRHHGQDTKNLVWKGDAFTVINLKAQDRECLKLRPTLLNPPLPQ